VDGGWPVALLIGTLVPRHWVLATGHPDRTTITVYNPANGHDRAMPLDGLRRPGADLGFPRAFAVVLPRKVVPGATVT
jgi:hypothetical protein